VDEQVAPPSVVAQPPVRFDPLPPLRPFPKAKYVFVVGAVPRRFGGRTASILNKCRLLKQYGGVDSIIVTLNYSAEIDDISADLRARGLLVDGVEIVNLHDFFDDESVVTSDPVQHEIDEPGMDKIRDPDQEVYRYFEKGVYRLYKRFDHSGRLIVRDWFNENRGRTRRDEFNPNGTIRRTTYMDLHFNKPRQEIYYRANGVPYLNKWLVVNPADRSTRVERITEFDEQGRPDRVLASNVELIHSYLDRLIGDDHAFLTVESRRSDAETLTYHRPNVKQVYVLHNPHLVLPGDDVDNVRPMYQPVLDRHGRPSQDGQGGQDGQDGAQGGQEGATVFLTNAQRADAEARYGERPGFRVIPHPIEPVEPTPFADRDPHLVVMLARLDEQKQIGDAIEAFSHVVASVPEARLEIYGHGPDEVALQRRIDERGLRRQIRLAGYTKDAAGLLRGASVSLLTSKFEGFGLVLLESLANGCPVVSYDIKYGPSDVVRDGVNGFLVPARARRAMAARVVELLTDTELRRRMSAAAREIGTEFSEQAFVARWSALFADLDAEGWDEGTSLPGYRAGGLE
jgi:poly(glycerol-phosphate) alpha-glucosyltransferase